MDRGEDQDAEAGELERHLHRLAATKLAYENHVGVLAAGAANRVGEARGVVAHFPVCDLALLRGVNELDRIFDGEDVSFAGSIDVIQHCRKRRALAATRRARHQHQAGALL